MKTTKKILTLVLALALIFALAAPAFATGNDASYTQVLLANSPTQTGEFTVYLTILSGEVDGKRIARYDVPVSMGESGVTAVYHVSDVLAKAAEDNDWLTIYSTPWDLLTGTSSAVTTVIDTSVVDNNNDPIEFTRLLSYDYRNGWMFRINDMYPLLNPSNCPSGHQNEPYGATIQQAYVSANDHITLYFADTDNLIKATRYTRIESHQFFSFYYYLKIFVSASYSYYDANNNDYWEISDFAPLTDDEITVYVNGVEKTATYLNTPGYYGISGVTTISGDNIVEFKPSFTSYNYGGVSYGITTFTSSARIFY